jgi:hypothetical protein
MEPHQHWPPMISGRSNGCSTRPIGASSPGRSGTLARCTAQLPRPAAHACRASSCSSRSFVRTHARSLAPPRPLASTMRPTDTPSHSSRRTRARPLRLSSRRCATRTARQSPPRQTRCGARLARRIERPRRRSRATCSAARHHRARRASPPSPSHPSLPQAQAACKQHSGAAHAVTGPAPLAGSASVSVVHKALVTVVSSTNVKRRTVESNSRSIHDSGADKYDKQAPPHPAVTTRKHDRFDEDYTSIRTPTTSRCLLRARATFSVRAPTTWIREVLGRPKVWWYRGAEGGGVWSWPPEAASSLGVGV